MTGMLPPSEPWKSEWRRNLEASRETYKATEAARKLQLRAIRASNPVPQQTVTPTKPPSRQLLWQQRQQAKGNCRICGKPRDPNSKSVCTFHLHQASERHKGSLETPTSLIVN